jgi:hemolysin III
MFKSLRQPVSGLTHFIGAVATVIGQVFLYVRSANAASDRLALLIYSISLFCMFTASSIYHSVNSSPKMTMILRKFDHSAIYLLIAGTYTPFCLIAFHGFWKWGLLAIVWVLAVAGIATNMWTIKAPRWITAGIYVLMGWMIIFALREMLSSLTPAAMIWLVIGGLIYTFGAVIYSTKRMDFFPNVFGFHEVWHIFVMLGAAAHYIAVFNLIP